MTEKKRVFSREDFIKLEHFKTDSHNHGISGTVKANDLLSLKSANQKASLLLGIRTNSLPLHKLILLTIKLFKFRK